MFLSKLRSKATILLAFSLLFPGRASAGLDTAYVTPIGPADSNVNFPSTGINSIYIRNIGYAFITGGAGPYDIDWMKLGLSTSTVSSGSGSVKVALHGTTNSIVNSAVASAVAYATDIVSFTMPTLTSTNFKLSLTALELPNITSFLLQPNTAYSLILYAPSVNIGVQRKTGIANGATNSSYIVTNGFTMLDTFRNNGPNYTNANNSYPTFDISFGVTSPATLAAPGPLPILGVLAGFGASRQLRKRIKSAKA